MVRRIPNTWWARRGRGFTLIEAALTTVIIGLGVLAAMQLFEACTRQNATSAQMTTALMLAGHVQEMTQHLAFNDPATGRTTFGAETGESLATYDDLDDFDGRTFNPPLDATRASMSDLSRYSQAVSVWPVYPDDLGVNTNEASPDIPKTTYTGAVRVCVQILYRSRLDAVPATVYVAAWTRFDR
jgi:type II secretory pathway pseudopilin PulG